VGLLVIAVQDTAEAMQRFVHDGGWQFPVAVLPDQVAASYGIRAVPTLVVIRPAGRILKIMVGGASAADLTKMMDDLTG
jgi:hypothetical protein